MHSTKNLRILVTGGCGYKGHILVPKLLSSGYDVIVVDVQWFGNYLKPHPRLEVINTSVLNSHSIPLQGVDVVIHLASIANDPCGDLNPKLTWETSALATMQLIDLAVKAGVKQFIYASSGSVYGVQDLENVTEEVELNPISEYNKTKMVAERVVLSYQDRIAVQIVRPATVCGYSPRMRLDVSVNLLTIAALSKGNMTVYGGSQTRPNIHIDDICDLYVFLVKNPQIQGIFNAGFENMSILDIAKLINKHVPAKITITESADIRSYRVNSDKLLKVGFVPNKSVESAILELIEKYKTGELSDHPRYRNLDWMKTLIGNNG